MWQCVKKVVLIAQASGFCERAREFFFLLSTCYVITRIIEIVTVICFPIVVFSG